MKKILFIHNTLAEYRVSFFENMSKISDLTLLIYDKELSGKIYNINGKIDNNINIIDDFSESAVLKLLESENFDAVIIPPLDNIKALKISKFILKYKKQFYYDVVLFWEKWEAPKNKQPFLKKIKNKIQYLFSKRIINKLDKAIAAGSKSKEYFENFNMDKDKIFVAYDGVNDIKLLSEDYELKKSQYKIKNKKIILFFGRIIKRKGLEILIDALADIDNNYLLLICGDGPELENCQKLASEKLKIEYIFLGHISPQERGDYFSLADIFVLPSYFYQGIPEAWGLTVNESLCYNTPVVATNAVGSAFDLIINGKTGYIAKENDVASLRNCIEEAFLLNKEVIQKNKKHINSMTMAREFIYILEK